MKKSSDEATVHADYTVVLPFPKGCCAAALDEEWVSTCILAKLKESFSGGFSYQSSRVQILLENRIVVKMQVISNIYTWNMIKL